MPMLLAGEGVPVGAVCATPVTLCDASAAILDAVGASEAISELGLPGASLLDLANQPSQNRTVLSEFHTYGPDAFYMLRTLRNKYVYYVGAPPQLFDLEADPEELTDLGADPRTRRYGQRSRLGCVPSSPPNWWTSRPRPIRLARRNTTAGSRCCAGEKRWLLPRRQLQRDIDCGNSGAPNSKTIADQAAPARREVLDPLTLLLSAAWPSPFWSGEGGDLVFRLRCQHA